MTLGAYSINIIGLSNKEHLFHFEFGDAFFKEFGTDLVSEGAFGVDLSLDKRETFLEAEFRIKGTARLICDRSLEPFDYPVERTNKIVFKYGEKDDWSVGYGWMLVLEKRTKKLRMRS